MRGQRHVSSDSAAEVPPSRILVSSAAVQCPAFELHCSVCTCVSCFSPSPGYFTWRNSSHQLGHHLPQFYNC